MESVSFGTTVSASPDEVLRTYVEIMSANRNLELTQPVDGVLMIEDRWTPWWMIIPIILTFPLGLLLLLVKNTARVTVTVRADDEGTDVTVMGLATRKVADGLHEVATLLEDDDPGPGSGDPQQRTDPLSAS